jgi:hypothetical protein
MQFHFVDYNLSMLQIKKNQSLRLNRSALKKTILFVKVSELFTLVLYKNPYQKHTTKYTDKQKIFPVHFYSQILSRMICVFQNDSKL